MLKEQIVETKICKHCGTSFDITDADVAFYDKVSPIFAGKKCSIPTPTFCPDCRFQRRTSFRNDRKLYKRTCDMTGEQMISVYPSNSPYTVYEHKVRRGDSRDPLSYGRDFDQTKSFFSQFDDLLKVVPRINLNGHDSNQNSTYVNYIVQSKNCYLCFGGGYNEDVMYANYALRVKDSCEVTFSFDDDVCYEIIHCTNGHNLKFAYNCANCSNGAFLENCTNCHNCILCSGLVNKEYCYLNKQCSKEEFATKAREFYDESIKNIQTCKTELRELSLPIPKLCVNIFQSENCTGDYIYNCKNLQNCFNAWNAEDCKYCDDVVNDLKNTYDATAIGLGMEMSYEMMTASMNLYHCLFSVLVRENGRDIYYCSDLSGCTDCFGCTGLKNKSYCILNKQYTKAEYEQLVPQIIERMIQIGERGEFLPTSISPFGYNETVAYEYFPLSRGEAIARGYKWSDYESPLPKVQEENVVVCEISGKPFRILPQEIAFYNRHKLPLPTKHPDIRHLERMQSKNPRKLRDRTCDKCGIAIKTTYSPERKEIVYCETCYNKEVYG